VSNYRRNRFVVVCAGCAAALSLVVLAISKGCKSQRATVYLEENSNVKTPAADREPDSPAPPLGSANANAEGDVRAGNGEMQAAIDKDVGAVASSGTGFSPSRFVWPTPLAVNADTPWQDIAQAAASGDPATGLFGNARNSGWKFHEGLDIRPVARDRRGEPTDVVSAAISGVVVHVAPTANGAYGRHVVVRHAEPGLCFYTLYAHLRSTAAALRVGQRIEAGTALGVMGRSDGSGGFAKARAHMHFEIGVRLTPDFRNWYARRRREFGSANHQGIWNGYNLYALDPLPFLREGLRTGVAPSLLAEIRREPTAVTLFVNSRRVPAFVRENPALLAAPVPANLAGWKVELAWHGMPLRLTPLASPPVATNAPYAIEISDDATLREKARARHLLTRTRRGTIAADKVLTNVATLLFE
jgi:murein DD-endopeptidase MepM/ murein hydrolase activator NlpD